MSWLVSPLSAILQAISDSFAGDIVRDKKPIHVGLCGAGIGGVFAAIAFARAGAKVTVLEAADHLGEVGSTTSTR